MLIKLASLFIPASVNMLVAVCEASCYYYIAKVRGGATLTRFLFCPVLELQIADGRRFRPRGSKKSQAHCGQQIWLKNVIF